METTWKERDGFLAVKMPVLSCVRCGHTWIPSKEKVTICPRCKNRYFWKESSPMGRPRKR